MDTQALCRQIDKKQPPFHIFLLPTTEEQPLGCYSVGNFHYLMEQQFHSSSRKCGTDSGLHILEDQLARKMIEGCSKSFSRKSLRKGSDFNQLKPVPADLPQIEDVPSKFRERTLRKQRSSMLETYSTFSGDLAYQDWREQEYLLMNPLDESEVVVAPSPNRLQVVPQRSLRKSGPSVSLLPNQGNEKVDSPRKDHDV